MAGIQIQGATGAVVEAGPATAKGLHTISKPQDYDTLGHYRLVLTTGTIAAGIAANAEILQFRWTDATRFAIVQEIAVLEFRNITTAFAAGPFNFFVTRSTGWSADGTGGTAVTLTSPQAKVRTTMGAPIVGTVRISTTAALGAGTKTLDTNPMGATFGNTGSTPAIAQLYIPAGSPVTGYGGPGVELMHPDIGAGEHPVVVGTNEGVSVRVNMPGTGTWIASILIKWAEVTAF